MSIGAWLKRLRLWRPRKLDDEDLQAEIRAHLAIAADERMAEGVDRRTAHLASLKDFGNVTLITEAAQRVWTPRWIEAVCDLVSDVRYGIRALLKNPVFTLTVIAVLTLGVGLNAAVFAVLKGMTLTPIPGVSGSARIAVVFAETNAGRQMRISYPDYQYLRDHDGAFAQLTGSSYMQVNLGRGRRARQSSSELVTGNYFEVLGVRAQLGRTLTPSDEIRPGGHPVVVISDALWRSDFGSDPEAVGKTLEINNYPFTIVGVVDRTFHGTIVGYENETYIPVMMAAQLGITGGLPAASAANVLSDPHAAVLFPHAHLRPGTSFAAAAAQTGAIWTTRSADRPLTDAAEQVRVVPFWRSPTGPQLYMLPTLVVSSAMGLLVLMIACANIAGLVLVRGLSRRGEIAVRLALGATRARILRLLVVENLVLAATGAALGVLLAARGIPMFNAYLERAAAPQRVATIIAVDNVVIGFAVLVACGCALVFGLVPALQSSRVDLVSVINEDASPRGASRGRLRTGLVVAQVAVSLLLLVGAALVTRSLDAARSAYPGFDRDGVATLEVDVKQNAYDDARGRMFYQQLLNTARSGAGVESATLAAYNPLAFLQTRASRLSIDGYQPQRGEDVALMNNTVGPDYFRTLRIPIVAGRAFEDRDDDAGAPVAIVNATFAQRFWGGAPNALGKRISVADNTWRTVIGVAADLKYAQINEAPRPYFYLPFLQAYRSDMILYTRGRGSVDRLVDQSRAAVAALDPDLPILRAASLRELGRRALFFYQLSAAILFIFGTAGMALAAMGTYGLVAYIVKQSTHEIGIRMALGASGVSVVRDFLTRGLRLGALGAALGLVGAVGMGRLIGTVLYGVEPTDPVSFAYALALVLAGVVAATVVPAWRAARTNPLATLRHQ